MTVYKATAHISLVSNFLASILLGRYDAPLDRSDVAGMNLWDIDRCEFDETLRQAISGQEDDAVRKLGDVHQDATQPIGRISTYFVERYGFPSECLIDSFTGDNPATILSLPLLPGDVILSLGTSTTLLLSTPTYASDPAYHLFPHPTTSKQYMAMLCYKNGGLAREQVRDAVNGGQWHKFDDAVFTNAKCMGRSDLRGPFKFGFYFPLPEIIPRTQHGHIWRFECSDTGEVKEKTAFSADEDAKLILESQALSIRARAQPLFREFGGRPRRIFVVGGGSKDPAIVSVFAQILGYSQGVYRLSDSTQAGACALGSAHKAAWMFSCQSSACTTFETFIQKRWSLDERTVKLDAHLHEDLWQEYGRGLTYYMQCEHRLIDLV